MSQLYGCLWQCLLYRAFIRGDLLTVAVCLIGRRRFVSHVQDHCGDLRAVRVCRFIVSSSRNCIHFKKRYCAGEQPFFKYSSIRAHKIDLPFQLWDLVGLTRRHWFCPWSIHQLNIWLNFGRLLNFRQCLDMSK